jgi:MFS family permease
MARQALYLVTRVVKVSRHVLPLYAVLAASAISTTGNLVALLAVPWFVLETTGSAALTGVTAAVTVLPTIISGALGGVLVDRIGHRRTSVLADLASAVAVAAIPILHVTVGIAAWQLLLLVFVGAILDLPAGTARSSLIPELAERAGMPLERANSLMSATQQGGRLAGPLIAGTLIASVGTTAALWFDAATFVVAAGLIAAVVPRPRRPAQIERISYVEQLRRGVHFVRDDRVVRLVLLIITITNFLVSPVFTVGLAIYANQVLGSAIALGMLSAALGAGALAGAATYAAIGHRLPRRGTFVGALTASGAPVAVLGVTEELLVGVAVLAFVGFAAAPLNPLIITLIQERTPSYMRAQVIGAAIALAWVAMPIGMLAAGAVAEAFGVRVFFAAVGAAFLLVLLAILPMRVLQELDRPAMGPRAGARTPDA